MVFNPTGQFLSVEGMGRWRISEGKVVRIAIRPRTECAEDRWVYRSVWTRGVLDACGAHSVRYVDPMKGTRGLTRCGRARCLQSEHRWGGC